MKKKLVMLCMTTGFIISGWAIVQNNTPQSISRGKEVYGLYCQNCHMENGSGMPEVNPPLVKADYMKRPAKDLISVILKGSTASLTINGKRYVGAMPAQEYLNDEQIADVLNYIKNSWGNKIPGNITPAMVKAQRK